MIVRFSTELSLGLKGSAKPKDGLNCHLSLLRLLFVTVASLMLLFPGGFQSVNAKIGESKISGNWQSGHGGSGLDGGRPSWMGVDAPQKLEKAERNLQIGKYNITRDGEIMVEPDGASATVKNIIIQYHVTTMEGNNSAYATIFDINCTNPIQNTLPLSLNSMVVNDYPAYFVKYDPSSVESSDIWNPTKNDADVEIGGTFGFCVRVDLWHAGYSVYFLETKFSATVDKTKEFDTLEVTVDRTEATNETVTNVDYDAELEATKCDVESKSEDDGPVSQGSVLGICVRSNTLGIEVVGWQDLTLKNSEELEFPAIADGSISTGLNNLVTEDCNEDNWCTAQVQLVSGFFTRDGSFNATGTVILGLTGARRQLEKATDTYSQRTLEEEGGSGTFDISIEMDSPVSAASSMNAPHLQIITFALVSLLAFALY